MAKAKGTLLPLGFRRRHQQQSNWRQLWLQASNFWPI
jgi:hypothetical protein